MEIMFPSQRERFNATLKEAFCSGVDSPETTLENAQAEAEIFATGGLFNEVTKPSPHEEALVAAFLTGWKLAVK